MKTKSKKAALAILGGATITYGVSRLYQQYQDDIKEYRQKSLEDSEVVSIPSGDIQYSKIGEGFPILIAHGALGGYDQGKAIANFIGTNYRWIAVSRAHYLNSTTPNKADPVEQARTYCELLDALHIDKAFMVGVSAGGPSSIQFAFDYPDRCVGLLLISAVTRKLAHLEPLFTVGKYALRTSIIPWLGLKFLRPATRKISSFSRLADAWDIPDKELWENAILPTFLPVEERYPGTYQNMEMLKNMDEYDISEISVPILLLHAENDPLVPIIETDDLERQTPMLRVKRYPSGGHLMTGNHEDIKSEVQSFLDTYKPT